MVFFPCRDGFIQVNGVSREATPVEIVVGYFIPVEDRSHCSIGHWNFTCAAFFQHLFHQTGYLMTVSHRIGRHAAQRSMIEHAGAIHQIRAFAEVCDIPAKCGKTLIVVAAKPPPRGQHQQGVLRQFGNFLMDLVNRLAGAVDKDEIHALDRGNAGFEILFKFPAFPGIVGENHDGTGIGIQGQSGADCAFRVVPLNDAGDIRMLLFDIRRDGFTTAEHNRNFSRNLVLILKQHIHDRGVQRHDHVEFTFLNHGEVAKQFFAGILGFVNPHHIKSHDGDLRLGREVLAVALNGVCQLCRPVVRQVKRRQDENIFFGGRLCFSVCCIQQQRKGTA